MAKHHGMRFQVLAPDNHGEIIFYNYSPLWNASLNGQDSRFYIHPECIEMLSAHIGDRVLFEVYNYYVDSVSLKECMRVTAEEARDIIAQGGEIIARDGKLFIWPEMEA